MACRRLNVQVPAPANVSFGTVDPQTGTWEYKDKALGAGVEVGPDGAALITRPANAPQASLTGIPLAALTSRRATLCMHAR